MIAVALPVGVTDPSERLRLIVAETSRRKHTPTGGVAGIVSMPAGLARLGVLWARHAAATHINLYVTNVPGPQFALYAAGAQMSECYPVVPLAKEQAVTVGLTSYNGGVFYGLNADRAAMADVDVLADCLERALAELVAPVR